VGAGTGATVGKLFGRDRMMKSGVGTASIEISGGVTVAALAVVNALGDVIDPQTGKIIAGARVSKDSREFANTAQAMMGGKSGGMRRENTTLVCVATDAAFGRVQMSKIAEVASIGMARSISPVFTMSDGDIVISLSVGDRKAPLDSVGVAASLVVAEAILRAVKTAPSMNGIPGLAK
jgi:L-aminopeptidase/D-esterase-like protein